MYVHAPPPAQTQTIVNDGRRISIQTQISSICNSSEYKRLSIHAPNDDRMIAWRKELTRLNTELALLVSLTAVPAAPTVPTPVTVAVAPEAEVEAEPEEEPELEEPETADPPLFDAIDDMDEFS
jgi:hypothetical protein